MTKDWKKRQALPVCAGLVALLLAAGEGTGMMGQDPMPSDFEDIKSEIARRQQDIDRIDESLEDLETRLAGYEDALAEAEKERLQTLERVRKMIIFHDRIGKETVISLLASANSIQQALVEVRTLGRLLDTAVGEYNDVKAKKAGLEAEVESIRRETSNLTEIKNILQKRQMELRSRLHPPSQSRLYI
jgi:chromosome segregation ATPase